MNIFSIDDIIGNNIKTYVECFESTKDTDGKLSFVCCIGGCKSKYTEKSSAIRHLRKHHKEIYDSIRSEKIEERAPKNQTQNPFYLRVKVNPIDILNACVDLVTVHGLPISAVEYPAFKRILNPYVMALKLKGFELVINKKNIKEHIKSRTNEIKKNDQG